MKADELMQNRRITKKLNKIWQGLAYRFSMRIKSNSQNQKAFFIFIGMLFVHTCLASFNDVADESRSKNTRSEALESPNHSIIKSNEVKNNKKIPGFLEESLYGILRTTISLPLEHPFDHLKTNLQSKFASQNTTSLARDIYRKKGFVGFYPGFLPNFLRYASKEAYRWPLMLQLPRVYEKVLSPEVNTSYPYCKMVLTGGTIANIESVFITPLERLKVWCMTAKSSNKALFTFFKLERGNIHRELFRGFSASYAKQMVSWITFLTANDTLRAKSRSYLQTQELPLPYVLTIGSIVGIINTVTTLPLDCIKTNLQMQDSLKNKTFINTSKLIFKQKGLRGFYLGWQARGIQYILNSMVTVTIIEKFVKNTKQ